MFCKFVHRCASSFNFILDVVYLVCLFFLSSLLPLFFITTITSMDNEALSIFNASILQSQMIAINSDLFD